MLWRFLSCSRFFLFLHNNEAVCLKNRPQGRKSEQIGGGGMDFDAKESISDEECATDKKLT